MSQGKSAKVKILNVFKEYLKSSHISPYTAATTQNSGTYTEQFSDMVDEMREFKAKAKRSPAAVYQSRYSYIGTIKKETKWRPIIKEEYGPPKPIDTESCGEPRKNYCMLLGYSGAKYHGSQRLWNHNDNTIEEYVLKSLLKNEWLTSNEYRYPYTCSFDRASRTDKGVSAKRLCLSFFARKNMLCSKH